MCNFCCRGSENISYWINFSGAIFLKKSGAVENSHHGAEGKKYRINRKNVTRRNLAPEKPKIKKNIFQKYRKNAILTAQHSRYLKLPLIRSGSKK